MQSITMLPKLFDATQTISFSEGDGVCSVEVYTNDVMVTTNAGAHNHGSSKMKLKSLVDYNWEPKFYSGQLLALHMNGKYLAYSIKAPNTANPGTWSGMVRVVYNPESGTDRRALIKGMKGEVQDLSFAHIENQVVLACVDEQGNFYVHEIEVTDCGLRCTLIAEVREDSGLGGSGHRVVWCPYIPDEDDDDDDVVDVARLLLTTHVNTARVWNMRLVAELVSVAGAVCGASTLLGSGAVQTACNHTANIVDAAFSPDGTALATAAADGYVMFFEVYKQNETTPRCLHKWQPHDGLPLSCLFFLDNHDTYNTDSQFWKYAVTGAENNTILKIWSCKSWNCLQTINFAPGLGSDTASLGLKAMVDKSARYLVVSELKSRCLYVLQVRTDAETSTAHCTAISEYLLPYPVLSFILRAEEQVAKCESSCDDPFHRNGSSGDMDTSPTDYDLHRDESPSQVCTGVPGSGGSVRLRLYLVQPKGLQEATIIYSPLVQLMDSLQGVLTLGSDGSDSTPAIASSILQQQSQQLKNLLMRSQTQPGSLIGQRSDSPPSVPPPLTLMTPDAFSSPGKREEEDPPLSATPDPRNALQPPVTGYIEEVDQSANEQKFISAGSSPSREIQEIMLLADYYKDQTVEDDGSCGIIEDMDSAQNGDTYSHREDGTPEKSENTLVLSTETSWPQISIAQINEANQRKATGDKSSGQSANRSLDLSANRSLDLSAGPESIPEPPEPRTDRLSAEDRGRLEALEVKLDKLTELLSQQSREIRALRSEVKDPREVVEQALSAHTARTTAAIDSALTDGWERVSRVGETAARAAAQAAGLGAAHALEPLVTALHSELATKLSATDLLLRENLDKLVTSKTVMEKLTSSVSSALAELVRGSFREVITGNILPAMEKAHTHMFRQLTHIFQQGTKEFLTNAEEAARVAAERGGSSASALLVAALDRHKEALAAVSIPPSQHHVTAAIADATRSVLEKELVWWRSEARGVVSEMSRTHSPAPTSVKDRQMQVQQIQSLMGAGDVNGAFQLALSASDLTLVMCACRAADPHLVFGRPCRLKQHVLLSLVQQLAADMTHDTQLKHRYLEDAIINLDRSNPVTREHLPVVIRELQKQLSMFLSGHPTHTLARQLRMLLMATDSLLLNAV